MFARAESDLARLGIMLQGAAPFVLGSEPCRADATILSLLAVALRSPYMPPEQALDPYHKRHLLSCSNLNNSVARQMAPLPPPSTFCLICGQQSHSALHHLRWRL